MAHEQTFWPVDAGNGEPDLWVCMSCLSEVYKRKVPMPHCPTCQGVSTYEVFDLASIKDWGTDELVAKAEEASREVPPPPVESFAPPLEEQPAE